MKRVIKAIGVPTILFVLMILALRADMRVKHRIQTLEYQVDSLIQTQYALKNCLETFAEILIERGIGSTENTNQSNITP